MVLETMVIVEEITDDYEIIVIDDGSSDYSHDILKRLDADYPQVRVVYHKQNRGYGGALRSGFATATKDYIFYTDGDAQYDVRELKKLAAALDTGVEVVQGYKTKRLDPWYRILVGKAYQHIMKFMFGLKITDVDCDFRLIKRSLFERVTLEKSGGVICLEMIKKFHDANAVFVEVPVNHFFRAYGRSQFFNFKRVFRVGTDVLELWWALVVSPWWSGRSKGSAGSKDG